MIEVDIKLDRKEFKLETQFQTSEAITGLFGPSGAGKSTLLSCIAGLTNPDHGHIAVEGMTLFDSKSRTNIPPHKRNIGVVFQDSRLLPNFSVEGNLNYGMSWSQRKNKGKLLQIADALEIAHLLKRNVRDLSGGERQRIALGRAILSDPSLLLLDEPFSALDQKLIQKVLTYINAIYKLTSIPMIIVSHDITTILELTDQIVVVDNGRCIASGNIKDLSSKFNVMRIATQQGYAFSKGYMAS
jgi:molybdate transport system ATP-binding protein